jgi:hypothetical protein
MQIGGWGLRDGYAYSLISKTKENAGGTWIRIDEDRRIGI